MYNYIWTQWFILAIFPPYRQREHVSFLHITLTQYKQRITKHSHNWQIKDILLSTSTSSSSSMMLLASYLQVSSETYTLNNISLNLVPFSFFLFFFFFFSHRPDQKYHPSSRSGSRIIFGMLLRGITSHFAIEIIVDNQ